MELETRLPPGSPAHALGQVLYHEARNQNPQPSPWRKFFEAGELVHGDRNPITKIIMVEGERLRNKWQDFRCNCTDGDRLDLDAYEPTMESVFGLVQDVQRTWESKRRGGFGGKIAQSFQSICGTLDSHSSMLKVLPDGNEYVSIFTGTLMTVIKASANHERIADGLSESLLRIGQNITACTTDLEMFKTPIMLEHVSELYGLVFLFLSTFMDWFAKKRRYRILDSFNENLAQKFEDEVKAVTQKATLIRELVEQNSRAEVRETRTGVDYLKAGVDGLRRDVRAGLEGSSRQRAELSYYGAKFADEFQQAKEERKQNRQLITQLTQLLRQNADSFLRNQPLSTGDGGYLLEIATPRSELSEGEWTADEIALYSAHLESYFHRDRIRLPYDTSVSIPISQHVLSRIADWTEQLTEESTFMWVDGPPTMADDLANPITMIAAQFVELASTSKVPVVSYFCELRRGETLRGDNSSLEVQSIIGLLYSILRQMVELLLPLFRTNQDLSQERFRLLAGTTESWDDALQVFRDLVELMPDKVFCVIDGLHWIDDNTSKRLLEDIVGVLRNGRFKTLFTTSGRAPSLKDKLKAAENCVIQRMSTRLHSARLDNEMFEKRS